MLEQLQQIETTVIDELMTVKRERETVAARLAKMDEEKGKVTDAVFRRVRRDYESKATALERKAQPLKDRARQEYAKLKALLDTIESQHASAQLDKEEIELRHRLGEFDDQAFDAQLRELESKLADQKAQMDEAAEVRERFVAAFDSEDDLAVPAAAVAAASAAPVPAPAPAIPPVPAAPVTASEMDAGITAPQPLPEPPPPAARVVPPPPAPAAPAAPADGTVILPSEAPPPPPPARAATTATPAGKAAAAATAEPVVARTVVLALAKLVAVDADLGAPEFPLQPLSFIGRTPDNQVRLNRPAVSRRHAQITQTDKGWSIKDLQSENGTYVNGERIQERALADGDRVQIGTVRLLFRAE